MRHLAWTGLVAVLLTACSPTSAPVTTTEASTSPPPVVAEVAPELEAESLPPTASYDLGTDDPIEALPSPSTESTTPPTSIHNADVVQPILVAPAAAPDSVDVTYVSSTGDINGPITVQPGGLIEIPVIDGDATVSVTVRGFSIPDPKPDRWRFTLNGGQRQDIAGNPVTVTYVLEILGSEEDATYTILGRVRYRGWGEDAIQIVLNRPSP